jgi:hypothetical protein
MEELVKEIVHKIPNFRLLYSRHRDFTFLTLKFYVRRKCENTQHSPITILRYVALDLGMQESPRLCAAILINKQTPDNPRRLCMRKAQNTRHVWSNRRLCGTHINCWKTRHDLLVKTFGRDPSSIIMLFIGFELY